MKKMIFPIAALLLVSCNASDQQNEGTTSLSVHSVDTMVETVRPEASLHVDGTTGATAKANPASFQLTRSPER